MIAFNRLRLLLIVLFSAFLFSCTNTHEDLQIKKDGSGTLSMKTDVGKLLEMLKSFGGDSAFAGGRADHPMDTLMLMKDFVDTARDVPADKKALLRDGKVHVVMNMAESIGKIDFNLPFKSTSQLQQLYQTLNSGSGLGSILGGMGNQLPGNNTGNSGIPQVASVYDIVIKDGSYSRKVNLERYEEFTKTMKLDEFKQMSGMFGEMDYTLSVTVPRPIKKSSNPQVVLSADKKTATLKTDLLQTFEHPALLAMDLEY